ncbi:MAG: type ISP restriction/modification enzyme, partial [Ignavibacteria bacterium]|nr:type ISP restriction/modification enzyme [Ignavibacteria bacterium]
GYQSKLPNLSQELVEELKSNFIKSITPEEIFYYIYAILYSNTYRTKYAEFLKGDFPRIPFTKDYKHFIKLGKLGKELADLHLLKSNKLSKTISAFPVKVNKKIEKLKYEDEKVWINKDQYFSNVKPEVWEYQIGGHQVCEKWLKDRKDRTLNLDEIQTYCQIVTALSKTIELQKKIDDNYDGVEN